MLINGKKIYLAQTALYIINWSKTHLQHEVVHIQSFQHIFRCWGGRIKCATVERAVKFTTAVV